MPVVSGVTLERLALLVNLVYKQSGGIKVCSYSKAAKTTERVNSDFLVTCTSTGYKVKVLQDMNDLTQATQTPKTG